MLNKLKFAVISRAIAILILLVFAGSQFITIFHHHSFACHLTKKEGNVKHHSIAALEDSCKICNLLNDSFTIGYHLPADLTFFISGFQQTMYSPSFPFEQDAKVPGFSNKGPPLV